MSVALKIFRRDLKRVLTNPVAVVITIGVAIIPSLYAWFNILANWNPYENTSTVPIAVVIEDEGANIADIGFTNAGEKVRAKLAENTQLGWTFLDSEDEAVEAVRAGSYYAAFVIPQDFTASLADVLQGDTNQAHIAYYVNEKVNAISPKVTDTGATTLETQIANEFVGIVGETITEKLQDGAGEISSGVTTASASVAADLSEVETLVSDLASDLGSVEDTVASARATITSARTTLSELSGSSSSLASSLSSALTGLGTTRTQAQTLASQLSARLNSSATTLAQVQALAASDIAKLTTDIGTAQGHLDGAIANLRSLQGLTLSNLERSLSELRDAVDTNSYFDKDTKDQLLAAIKEASDLLSSSATTVSGKIDELQSLSDSIKAGNEAAQNLSESVGEAVQGGTESLTALETTISGTTIPELSSALDSFASVGGQLAGTASALSPMLTQADGTLAQLDIVLSQSADAVSQTADALGEAASDLGRLADDAAAIESAENLSALQDILGLDAEQVGDFVSSPVEMVAEPVYEVENYGSGVAPFYTNLALWVGGFVLVAIYKLEVDEEGVGHVKPWQAFFGRWLLLHVVGQIQALICCIGDIALGIQCISPAAYVFAGMVESFVYVFFIYAISVAFKHIGKALGVLLVILQIPGASGTYPIEMMPDFFRAVHPWLPFTYGINAMREAIAGFYGSYYAQNLLTLLLFLIPGLIIGVAARRHLLNVNALFDARLAETDLMIGERVAPAGARFRLSSIIKALMGSKEWHAAFEERAAAFELTYPVLVRRGFLALLVVPAVLLALLFVLSAKFALLMCWIVSLVVICGFLIVIEYVHSRIGEKDELAAKSREELFGMLDDEMRQEFMALAPIDAKLIEHARAAHLRSDADGSKGGEL